MSAELPAWLEERLKSAPREPGCYLMKDQGGKVVYVGKATSLRARLHQYFSPSTGDTRFFVGLLATTLGAIELIVTANAKEALVLENTLIKRHQPRFNVKLKDDKAFLSIRIGNEHPWPRLDVVRRRKADGARYFGPYASASAIRGTLRVINRYFGLRTCTDVEFRNRSRPCLEHQIGRCPAPCVLPVEPESYTASIQEVELFLRGRGEHLVKGLRARMQEASDGMDYERAARYRDQIMAIERSLERQNVALSGREDIDVIGLYREGADGVAQILEVRGGLLAGSRAHALRGVELPDEEVLENVMLSRYDGAHPIPDRVLICSPIEDTPTWEELLSELRGRAVRVHQPQRGEKRKLLDLALRNAEESFRAQRRNADQAVETLEALQRRLGLRQLPARIECYDISNIQGTDPTGSMVVALDGALSPRDYRSFNVRSQETPDDFRMMEEVLTRRFEGGEALGELPDLVVIDGGKGQLGIAVAVLEALEIGEVELCSLAKSRVLDADGHVQGYRGGQPTSDDVERSPERVFRPGRKNPVALRPNSNGLFLLQKLRDEAHRFAITHHKRRRKKRNLRSVLNEIPGVGPKRAKTLLSRFGSVQGIRDATVDELASVPGISQAFAHRLKAAL